jgi:hypothetical protein
MDIGNGATHGHGRDRRERGRGNTRREREATAADGTEVMIGTKKVSERLCRKK